MYWACNAAPASGGRRQIPVKCHCVLSRQKSRTEMYETKSSAAGTRRAKNSIAGRMMTFSVLGFWDRITVACAGAMPFRRDLPATTNIQGFQARSRPLLPGMEFVAWKGCWCGIACSPVSPTGAGACGCTAPPKGSGSLSVPRPVQRKYKIA